MTRNTRKSVLTECLEHFRGMMKQCSEGYKGRLPAKGKEELFYDLCEKCRIMQELIHAYDNENVRRAIAEWQQDVMDNGPTALKLDGGEPVMRMTEEYKHE